MKFASSSMYCFLVYVVYKKYYRKNNVEFPEGRDNEPVPDSSFQQVNEGFQRDEKQTPVNQKES